MSGFLVVPDDEALEARLDGVISGCWLTKGQQEVDVGEHVAGIRDAVLRALRDVGTPATIETRRAVLSDAVEHHQTRVSTEWSEVE